MPLRTNKASFVLASQQYFSLIPNRLAVFFSHTKSALATSQLAVFFSHNKSAPTSIHSQANRVIVGVDMMV